jgi:hypothetical protein
MDGHSEEYVPTEAEGWYLDPYERHEQRWFSAGSPTSLVRDGVTEGQDDPPGPLPHDPEPVPEVAGTTGADDLKRADKAEAGSYSSPDLLRADGTPLPDPDVVTDVAVRGPLD